MLPWHFDATLWRPHDIQSGYYMCGQWLLFLVPTFSWADDIDADCRGSETVFCVQLTGLVPTAIEWCNPQCQLVLEDSGDEVTEAAAGGGKVAHNSVETM